jgi:hypothetical protein
LQALSCEINKDHSLLIQYIEQLKKDFPTNTTIYADKEKALENTKESQTVWKSAFKTVVMHNYSNITNLRLDNAGRRTYRKRYKKSKKSKKSKKTKRRRY